MGYNNVYRQLQGEIVGESAKAIKFSVYDSDQDKTITEWFPVSQLSSIHRMFDAETDTLDVLMVSEWILKQKPNMARFAGTTTPPTLSGAPTKEIPKIQDKLQHPPTSNWTDMDDDIPF